MARRWPMYCSAASKACSSATTRRPGLARIGLALVERPGFERFRARVYSVFGVHVSNWTQPLHIARGYLRRAFDAAQASGDVSFAAFSCIDLITNLLAAGTPLSEVAREAEKNREIVKGLGSASSEGASPSSLPSFGCCAGKCRPTGPSPTPSSRRTRMRPWMPFAPGIRRRSGPPASVRPCDSGDPRVKARAFMQDFAAGLAAVARDPPLWTVPTQFERADYQFFEALSRAALCDSTPATSGACISKRRWRIMSGSRPGRRTVPKRSNRATLVGAEIARLEGRELDAERLYEQAIRSARDQGFVQNEALAYELAARFYAVRGFQKIEQLYLRNARRCYLSWDADGKVRQLDRLHPQLREREERVSGLTSTIGAPVEHLDLATVIKLSQAVSGEIILDSCSTRSCAPPSSRRGPNEVC